MFDYRIAAYKELVSETSQQKNGPTKEKNGNVEDNLELLKEVTALKANPNLTGCEKRNEEMKIRKRYAAEILVNDDEKWEDDIKMKRGREDEDEHDEDAEYDDEETSS
jgi:hypothetical protein